MRRLALTTARTLRLGTALVTRRRLPFSITFILTHRCNFRCAYCDIPDAAGAELSTAELCRAIDELADAGMARASFSGGEALLRADAIDIIAHARSRGLMTSLNSNAWLLEDKLIRLPGILDVLMISLDGPEPVHDLVRRRRGSYARALRVIDAARELGIVVTTITVLSHANLHVIEEVLELADQHEFWAYFQPAYSDCFAHGRGLDPALTSAVLSDVADRLDRARSAGRRVGASAGYTERLARGPSFGDCSRCAAGRYFATLMPDGTFVPCHLTSGDRVYPNGRDLGFAAAFAELQAPTAGPGCAISPYQEHDLVFGLDARAVRAAFVRMTSARPQP